MSIQRVFYTGVISPLLDIWTAKRLQREGFYTIHPAPEVEPFELWLPGRGSFQRQRIRGELEPDVMQILAEHVSPGDTVFDVGAAWGYFSLAMSSIGADVYAFELEADRVESIRQSADHSNLEVTGIAGAVGDEISLDDYPHPDLIKMDIEGWEYRALQSAQKILETAHPTIVLEYHSPAYAAEGSGAVEADELYSYLEGFGYEITELEKRGDGNFHILAR